MYSAVQSGLRQYGVSLHPNVTDYVSATGGEGGGDRADGVREDIRVGQHDQVPEFPVSTGDSKSHPDVFQYRTGNYLCPIFFTSVSSSVPRHE